MQGVPRRASRSDKGFQSGKGTWVGADGHGRPHKVQVRVEGIMVLLLLLLLRDGRAWADVFEVVEDQSLVLQARREGWRQARALACVLYVKLLHRTSTDVFPNVTIELSPWMTTMGAAASSEVVSQLRRVGAATECSVVIALLFLVRRCLPRVLKWLCASSSASTVLILAPVAVFFVVVAALAEVAKQIEVIPLAPLEERR